MARKDDGGIQRLINLGITLADAQSLRRISMTLESWYALECGDGDNNGSWCITRGDKKVAGGFAHDEDGAPHIEHHHYLHGRGKDYVTYSRIPDRERGAVRRLLVIMARYPALTHYLQTDPRGCALYVGPQGMTDENYNSRGVAVYK